MGALGSLLRWIILIVGTIEILGSIGSLLSGGDNAGVTAIVLLVWVIAVALAADYQFNPKKVRARKGTSTNSETEK